MRIGILGCGSLGGIIAGRLWHARKDTVVVFEMNPDIVSSVKSRGLRITEGRKRYTARPEILQSHESLEEPLDLIILTTKATAMMRAVDTYLPAVSDNGCFMTVQNGLMAMDLIARYGQEKIVAGCVMWGSSMTAPGEYSMTANGPFVVGRLEGGALDLPLMCKEALAPAFSVKVSDDMEDVLWAKLTVTASLTSLGAITGFSFGEMLSTEEMRDLILEVGDEVVSVGKAFGIGFKHSEGALNVGLLTGDGFPPRWIRHLLVRAIGLKHRKTESSMLACLKAGVKTEIDLVNGVITDLGSAYGVDTPVNSAIVNIVKQMEAGTLEPGAEAFEQFRALLPEPPAGPEGKE